MNHHPIFEKFDGFKGPRRADIWIDWIGAQFPRALIAPFPMLENEEFYHPEPSEEYFEWIDLLDAAAAARDRFVMIELGAGWGRWGIRGAIAARKRGIPDVDLRFIEAEPQHAQWARECIELNSLAGAARVIEAAISYNPGPVPFAVDGWEGLDARSNYGQTVVTWGGPAPSTGETYCGRPIHRHPGGCGQIYVDSISFEAIAADLDMIDLVDADIQGGEQELVEHAIDTLSAKVRLVHIGTHSEAIEDAIRQTFRRDGWTCRYDFSLQGVRETPFGPVTFDDGVQSWLNPRFA